MTLERKRELDTISMTKAVAVKWGADEFLYVGGALATKEQYENFEESTAHVFDDGAIMRYGMQVGRLEELSE